MRLPRPFEDAPDRRRRLLRTGVAHLVAIVAQDGPPLDPAERAVDPAEGDPKGRPYGWQGFFSYWMKILGGRL